MRRLHGRAIGPIAKSLLILAGIAYLSLAAAGEYAMARKKMVAAIEQDVRQTSLYLDKQELDPRVMAAIAEVPRHQFVPNELIDQAYENRPLPIGHGQTISQPYIVAVMTDLLKVGPDSRVLELGTGSGYQAAVLSRLVKQVYSIEIIDALAERAEQQLTDLGYDNVQVRNSDGYYGWEEYAPFDAIIVTAAASHVPAPLIAQLKVGGRMMIPVGGRFMTQQLLLIHKESAQRVVTQQVLPVTFVPVTGGH